MAALTESELHEFMAGPVMDAARRQAGIVSDRYAGIEQQDVEQEIWVWFYGDGKRKAQRLVLKGDLAPVEKAFYNAAVDYCERERKASLGYDWRDDYNYSRPEVARLLPLALDPATIPGLSGGGLHDGPSAKSDPAYGGGMLASIVDVRSAFAKLSESDQQFVTLVVALDSQWDTIAVHTGMQGNSAYAKFMRILDRMVTRHLGRKRDDDAA